MGATVCLSVYSFLNRLDLFGHFEISGWPSPPNPFHRNPVLLFSTRPTDPTQPMNSYSSHGDLLADRLTRLGDLPVQPHDSTLPPPPFPPNRTPSYDGYGFRPPSGMSSPLIPPDRNSPLPDVNGLGWPGQFLFSFPSSPPPAPLTPSSFSKSTPKKQSLPSLASTPPPQRKRLAKPGSPRRSAPSSNASARIPIEKVSFARQNAMPRP